LYFSGSPGFPPSSSYTTISAFRADVGLTAAYKQVLETASSCYVLSGPADTQLYFDTWNDAVDATVGSESAVVRLVGDGAEDVHHAAVRGRYNAAAKTTTSFVNGVVMNAKGPGASACTSDRKARRAPPTTSS
jgi:hypothetical protein